MRPRQARVDRHGRRGGLGAFLGQAAARAAGLDVVRLADDLGDQAARCASAAAVALLLEKALSSFEVPPKFRLKAEPTYKSWSPASAGPSTTSISSSNSAAAYSRDDRKHWGRPVG